MILVESDVSGEWDSSTDWAALADQSVRAAVGASSHAAMLDSGIAFELSAKLTTDEEVKSLNAGYRGKDKPTNVLSFPMVQRDLLESISAADQGEVLLGDIVLAHGICAAEAAEKGITMRNHAAHLVVHGTLHLLGYDHEEGETQAEAMEEVERRALAGLGIADPYMEVQP
jgi:probable rRNA maturation factor